MYARCWAVGLALFIVAVASSAQGRGCTQECPGGVCGQAHCQSSSSAGGACACESGAVRLDENTFAAYCHAWGAVTASCTGASMAPDDAAALQLPPMQNADAMISALMAQNPYVTALVVATVQIASADFSGGPVSGTIHDSHYNTATGAVAHSAAVGFSGSLTTGSAGNGEIAITVQSGLSNLVWLTQYTASVAPDAVVPVSIRGTTSGGGEHGTLVVSGALGQTQTLQW